MKEVLKNNQKLNCPHDNVARGVNANDVKIILTRLNGNVIEVSPSVLIEYEDGKYEIHVSIDE